MPFPDPAHNEPFLLTPGPLTTSEGYDCVPMQGSGTFSVEAMLGSFIPRDGKVLVLSNGAYGQRIAKTLAYLGRAHSVIDKGDYLPPRGADVQAALKADLTITHVVAVHCETSSGILNPLKQISNAVQAESRTLLIDSMSAFGAIPLTGVRYAALVSSANKCIVGVLGFGFIIYPGKLTVAESFRIGRMDAAIMQRVITAAGEALATLGVNDASPPKSALLERAKLANKP